MSVLFNVLLFVGVFYLILRVPEPGDFRGKRATRTQDEAQPTRKIA